MGVLRLFGIKRKKQKKPKPTSRHVGYLQQHGINLVFDVGASHGQYAADIRSQGYGGRIVSFEPLPDAHAILTVNASHDPDWIVHERVALGSAPGSVQVNVAGNSVSSSVLPMLNMHADAAPDSVYVGAIEAPLVTLDSVLGLYVKPGDRVFLKIDTQGFEHEVLEGAEKLMPHVAGVQIELSNVPLYGGQKLNRHFIDYFYDRGFSLWNMIPCFVDQATGRVWQFDAIFFRNN
jgi:FkbM family methyltransferase